MRYKELIYQGVTYTEKYKIDEILTKHKFTWILDAEIENARMEILKDTFIWNGGIIYNMNWKFGVFRNGEIRYCVWENGVFYNGTVWDIIFKSGLIYNGTFYKGQFLGGEAKSTMPKTGVETKHSFINCNISQAFKGYKKTNETYNESTLFKQLDQLIYSLNEDVINESKILDSIKNRIKKFIEVNKNRINEKLPKLLDYIQKAHLSPVSRKSILVYIALTLSMAGANMAKAKEVFTDKGLDKEINWNKVDSNKVSIDDEKLEYTHFALGKYDIKLANVYEDYNKLKSLLPDSTKTINGTIVVTISSDPSNPANRNFAIDDSDEDKKSGGKLLDKRINAIKNHYLKKLQELFDKDSITIHFEVMGVVEAERWYYMVDVTAEKKVTNTADYEAEKGKMDEKPTNDSGAIISKPTGGFKDISKLSRNYQFVELLKLAGIDAKRFNGDKIVLGDEYAPWIIDTRKHIKSFLTRLSKAYPDYNITFDKTAKAITPISGAMAGVSRMGDQYTITHERIITNFDSFLLENEENMSETWKKWKNILGSKFIGLTEQQAKKFDYNIKTFLNYLEQMYGSSILSLRVGEKQEE